MIDRVSLGRNSRKASETLWNYKSALVGRSQAYDSLTLLDGDNTALLVDVVPAPTVGPDGDLHVRPIEEVKTLRGAALFSGANLTLEVTNTALKAISGLQLDIEVEVAAGHRIGISGRVHPDGREHTDVLYYPELARFSVNRDRATLKPSQSDNTNRGGSVRLNGASTHLRMLVDGALIETYLGEKYSLTTRAYPDRPEAAGVALIGNPDLLITRVAVYVRG